VIQIDRVHTNVDLTRSPAREGPAGPAPEAPAAGAYDPASRERFRELVLGVLRDHLRDLERRGV
jgi:hypothetical protein